MQAFSSPPITRVYDAAAMQTGRPAKHPRTEFGQKLHAAREAAGLSQSQVAEKMGVSQNAYAGWERHPVALKPEQIEQLAKILGVAADTFFATAQPAKGKRGTGPAGKLRTVFEEASKLPRHQQNKIAEWVDAFVKQMG